jgi:putative transposase
MKRANVFRLRPTREQEIRLFQLADNCSRMWNEINYKRRQVFFSGKFEWNADDEFYHRYKSRIGSATAQQIIIKNNEAWKSFFALLKKWKAGKLDEKPKPPGYWKDRKTGKRKSVILIRNDCYKIKNGVKSILKLPFGLKVEYSGELRWKGKQGRLEIRYNELSGKWYAYQSVSVSLIHQPIGNKKAYVDLGVINIITAWIEGEKQAIAYSGRPLLSDWKYWTDTIAEYQSTAKRINKANKTKRISRLYQIRKLRFRHRISTIIHRFVKDCYNRGVSEIVIGDIKNIRENNNNGSKVNSMVHNFWSFRYIIERLKTTAENYGINVRLVEESYTSSVCPFCKTRGMRRYRGLFYCPECSQMMNADVVGVLNIARKDRTIIPSPSWRDRDNGVMAHPLLHNEA